MLLLNKLKVGQAPTGQSAGQTTAKKNLDAHPPTPLDQLLADATGPVRHDGSDKFFGIENYGSTCYCNSIMQCLYYSAPFRENVLNFPPQALFDKIRSEQPNGSIPTSQTISISSYPSLNSPARKPPAPPTSPGGIPRPEESKDSPEYKKRQAITMGPVLDMVQDNSSKYGIKESLFTSLRDIFEAVIGQSSRKGVVSPHRFMEILKRENEMFRSAAHQDAHEFLNLLLNQVMDSVEILAKEHPDAFPPAITNGTLPDKSEAIDMAVDSNGLQISAKPVDAHWLHDLFEGHLTSETRCLTCETTSQRDEAFLDLSVDLEAHTSVTSCLHNFSKEEMLCERNKFHCDNCGGLQEAEKRMKIKRLPRILALHLKRFKYFEEQQRMQKLFHRVVYPFHLRLFNTTDDADEPDRLYELYAVVVHIGIGPYHGHYVSIIKSQDRGWLLFDDESVEPVDKSYVLKFFGTEPATPPGNQDVKDMACAYVLFYQETTLEAVLREQEAERNPASGRVSDAETAKDSVSSPILEHATTITTPIPEDVAPLEKLTHSMTAPHVPILTQPVRPTMTHAITNLFTSNGSIDPALKSRKELKLEEKERKAEEKARQRTDEKFQKYTPTPSSTMDEPRNSTTTSNTSDSNNGAATTTTTTTTTTTSAPPPPPALPTKEKESGFSRFRPGSMSIRTRSRLFSSSNKDKTSVQMLSNSNGAPSSSSSSSPFVEDSPVTALPFPTAANGGAAATNGIGNANGNGERNGEKKGLFGLGRKRNGN